MNNYVINNLSKDEQIKCKAKINKLAIIAPIVLIVFLLILGIVLSFLSKKLISAIDEPAKQPNGYFKPEEEPMPSSLKTLLKLIPWFFIIPIAIIPLVQILRILSIEIAVTNKRLIGKTGLIALKTIDIPLEQISNSSLSCGFFGRLFKYNTLEVFSTGMKIVRGNSVGLKIQAVSNAREFINEINNCIEENKKASANA